MPLRGVFNPEPAPDPGTPLKGQFCIKGPYPYGPRPGQPDNVFFLGELDALWAVDRALAERVKADYRSRGLSHLVCGPVYGSAYDGDYPDTDYRHDPARYAEFLTWWGGPFTLAVFPTHAPYYDWRGVWDLAAIQRDFSAFFAHPDIQRLVTRTMFCYEEYGRTAHMAECFDLYRTFFPQAIRTWHNPPGHLSPAMGDEDEQEAWRSAARHGIQGLYFQAHPVDDPDTALKPAIEQMKYDLWDMQRRFQGVNSPWGAPVLAEDGSPLEVVYAEGVAHGLYWDGSIPESVGAEWGAAARTVDGVVHCLDGA